MDVGYLINCILCSIQVLKGGGGEDSHEGGNIGPM
jgi:hypothetical protein